MSAQDNVQVVQAMFEAFGRGDLPALLDHVHEDVNWWVSGTPDVASYVGTYHGRDGVTEFFKRIAGAADFEAFEPQEFIAGGDQVAVVGYERIRAKSTGRPVEQGWVMIFDLTDGKVTRFRSFEDTAALAAAFR
jgi:uncharacterized protein